MTIVSASRNKTYTLTRRINRDGETIYAVKFANGRGGNGYVLRDLVEWADKMVAEFGW